LFVLKFPPSEETFGTELGKTISEKSLSVMTKKEPGYKNSQELTLE